MKCSVKNCKNVKKFKFPLNVSLKKTWLEAIRRPDFVPGPNQGLCIEHFSEKDIVTESYRDGYKLKVIRLKIGTVPTIFPWQKETNENMLAKKVHTEFYKFYIEWIWRKICHCSRTRAICKLRISNSLLPRIIDANNALPGSFPSMAYIETGMRSYRLSCGAVIASAFWILCAGHCILTFQQSFFSKMRIRVGTYYCRKADGYVQYAKIKRMFLYDRNISKSNEKDLGMLKLKDPLTLNDYVVPATLAQPDTVYMAQANMFGCGSHLRDNEKAIPKFLQSATVSVIENDFCESQLLRFEQRVRLGDSQFCTMPVTGDTSACVADSGGPLVQFEDTGPVVIGIITWGIVPCGQSGAPTMYAPIAKFTQWIKDTMTQNSD